MTISRYDLIAAGANFSFVHMDRMPNVQEQVDTVWKIEFAPYLRSAELIKTSGCSGTYQAFGTASSFACTRRKVAKQIEAVSPDDAKALNAPWASHASSGWPGPGWAVENGLNLDALLYSAVGNIENEVVEMYLDAGADPLAQTYLGDCAARLGVSVGMIAIFNRPEWLNATCATIGETGLFNLARIQMIDLLVDAVRSGADPDVRNLHGQTMLDALGPGPFSELEAAIADQRAMRISSLTAIARASDRHKVRSRSRL